jgi:hypothetical protein
MPANNVLTLRKGTASQWSSTNPILSAGEIGYDSTNIMIKIGDGISTWNQLSYIKHNTADIINLSESIQDEVSSLLVAGTGIGLNYNDSGNTLTISTTKNIILSDVVSSTNYIGIAPTGTSTSSSSWKIKRTIYTSGGAISSTGNALNVAWNDRLTASYS